MLTYVNSSSGSFSSLFLCCAPQNERKNIKFLTVQKVFKHYKNLVSIQNIFTSCVCQLSHEKCAVSDWIWARKKKKPPAANLFRRTEQVKSREKLNEIRNIKKHNNVCNSELSRKYSTKLNQPGNWAECENLVIPMEINFLKINFYFMHVEL